MSGRAAGLRSGDKGGVDGAGGQAAAVKVTAMATKRADGRAPE